MGWDLPDNVNPADTVCVQFNVPNDPKYIAAFWGAILDLSVGFNWANDTAHTAKRAAARMRRMYLEAQLSNCAAPCPPIVQFGDGDEDDMQIRTNPANPCQLQVLCPDGNWDTVFDASLCFGNPAPGGGTTPPGFGKCQSYNLNVKAQSSLILPFLVSTGDTIALTSAMGAGADGTLNWFCPDGSAFIAGACAGGGYTVPADPLNTVHHMKLIYRIGSSFYDATPTFTVPGGVASQPIYMQVNDSVLSDNAGDYNVVINYCNNSVAPPTNWCQDQDMTISPHGWSLESNPATNVCGGTFGGTLGSFVGGTGMVGTHLTQPDCVHDFSDLAMILDLGISTTFSIQVTGNSTQDNSGSSFVQVYVSNSPTSGFVNIINDSPLTSGAFSPSAASGGAFRYIAINAQAINSTATSGADIHITKIKLTGTGSPNPFSSSNC